MPSIAEIIKKRRERADQAGEDLDTYEEEYEPNPRTDPPETKKRGKKKKTDYNKAFELEW